MNIPTEEEIRQAATNNAAPFTPEDDGFEKGAQWMRDEILRRNSPEQESKETMERLIVGRFNAVGDKRLLFVVPTLKEWEDQIYQTLGDFADVPMSIGDDRKASVRPHIGVIFLSAKQEGYICVELLGLTDEGNAFLLRHGKDTENGKS